MERKYRVIEVTLVNGAVYYKIQRECKWLRKYIFCGPKVWKTYEDVYDGNWCSHTGWTFNINLGDSFSNKNDAQKKMNELIMNSYENAKIKSIREV